MPAAIRKGTNKTPRQSTLILIDAHHSSRSPRYKNEAFAFSLARGAMVLDAGAGDQPYRKLFSHCIYEAADLEKVDKPYAKSTYVCDLSAIPVEESRYDAILFNQVMEHLPYPAKVLHELNRVLKPGGKIICIAPLFYEEHEQPYDFYRYPQFAWRRLLSDEGFEVIRLDWMEGYFGTVAYQLLSASNYLPRRPARIAPGLLGWLALPVISGCKFFFKLIALLFYIIDERAKFTDSGFPKNYIVIARKP